MKMIIPILLLASAGCAGVPKPDPAPDGFVPIDEDNYDWRYMTADDVKFAARSFPRDPEGSLDFWASVIQKDLEGRQGYLLQSTEPIKAGNVEGRLMLFTAGGPQGGLYAVSVFFMRSPVLLIFRRNRIVTIEAGGSREEVEKELPKIKAAIEKLRLN